MTVLSAAPYCCWLGRFEWLAGRLQGSERHPSPASPPASLPDAGVNVGPLVASVGGLGVAIGLATQSVAQNVVGALSLYSGAQFVVGDRVQLMAAGAVVTEGTVEAIEPMCTTIRDNDGHPGEPQRWSRRGVARGAGQGRAAAQGLAAPSRLAGWPAAPAPAATDAARPLFAVAQST